MGANRRKPYPEVARERIKAALLLEKLENHVLGSAALTATQVNAAKILLGKVIPDMKAIDHTSSDGTMTPPTAIQLIGPNGDGASTASAQAD